MLRSDLLMRRLASLLAVLLLAFGLAACGESDEGNGGGNGGGTAADSADERQVRSTVEGLYEDLANYDAAAVCARMSPAARRQIARGAVGTKADGGKPTCETAFGNFLTLAKRNGGLNKTLTAKVGKVEIDGDDAVVTVSFGAQQGQIPLRKVDGEWKMGVSIATPSAPPKKPAAR